MVVSLSEMSVTNEMPNSIKNERKNGCEFVNNHISLDYSRKTRKPKKTGKINPKNKKWLRKFTGKMQNKFPNNDKFSVCLYGVDIKCKSHFWLTRNTTEKI